MYQVISAPIENAVSAIQLEAYKKYILASLIHYGQVRHTALALHPMTLIDA